MTKPAKEILERLYKLKRDYPDSRVFDYVNVLKKEKPNTRIKDLFASRRFEQLGSIDNLEIFYRKFCNAINISTAETVIQKKNFYGVTLGELIDDGVLIRYNEHNQKGQILRTTDGEVLYTWLPGYDNRVHMYWCGVITKDKKNMLRQPMNFTTDANSGYFYIGNGTEQTKLFAPAFAKLAVCEKCFDYIKSKNYGTPKSFNFAQFSFDNKINLHEIPAVFKNNGVEHSCICQYCGKNITELDDIKTDKNIVWCSDCDQKFRKLYIAKTTDDIDEWYNSVGKTNPKIENGFSALMGLIKYNSNKEKFELAIYMIETYKFNVKEHNDRQDIFTFLAESNYSKDNAEDMVDLMDVANEKGVKVRAYITKEGQKILGSELLNSNIFSVREKMRKLAKQIMSRK